MEPMTIFFIISLIATIIGSLGLYFWRRGHTEENPELNVQETRIGGGTSWGEDPPTHEYGSPIEHNPQHVNEPLSQVPAGVKPVTESESTTLDLWDNGVRVLMHDDFDKESELGKSAITKVHAAIKIIVANGHILKDDNSLSNLSKLYKARTDGNDPSTRKSMMQYTKFEQYLKPGPKHDKDQTVEIRSSTDEVSGNKGSR